MNITPMYDRVLCERVEPDEEVTPAGIILPRQWVTLDGDGEIKAAGAREKSQECVVVAVGEIRCGKKRQGRAECIVKPGERVLIGKWAGTDFEVEGKLYTIVHWHELIGVLR